MPEASDLAFAQRYPFSARARAIVQRADFDVNNPQERVVSRAALLVSHAWNKKSHVFSASSPDLLEQEILAFPVAKILVSFINDPLLYDRFAQLVSHATLQHLGHEQNRTQVSLDLAADLGLQFSPTDKKGFFASIRVHDFLQASFSAPHLKLVNQAAEKGLIYLSESDVPLFVSQLVFSRVRESLPVSLSGLPRYYAEAARQIRQQLKSRDVQEFELTFSGKIKAEFFPPCMKDLYSRLASGENIPHMARFDLATFLIAIGMPIESIDILFSKAPNYAQKTTLYHLNRMKRLELSPPACAKIREHGYCPLKDCTEKHPLLHYRRKLVAETQQEKSNAGRKKIV